MNLKLVTHTVHGSVNFLSGSPMSTPDLPLKKYAINRPLSWLAGFIFAYIPMIRENITIVHIPPALSTDDTTIEAVFKIWEDEKCCSSYVGAPLFHKLLTDTAHLKYNICQMKLFLLTGQPYIFQSITTLLKCFPSAKVRLVYGTTESSVICTEIVENADVEDRYVKLSISPGIEIKVIDDKGGLVPRGMAGEICVRSSTVFLGYLNNPQATKQAKTQTGWFHTTDQGVMDDTGRVEILGRDKELIKRAAANVVPGEIEFVMRKHPSVESVVVVGVPDKVLGEEICACVILNEKDGSSISVKAKLDELDQWCKEQWPIGPDGLTLAPKYILPMKTFPLTSGSAKIFTRQIKAEAIKRLETEGHFHESN